MLWTPKGGLLHQSNLGTDVTNPATLVTTGGTPSTKGTIVQAIAATIFDAYLIRIEAASYGASAIASEGALDVLLGTPTEYILIANLLMGYCMTKSWAFPLYIPAGSEISLQAAGARASTGLRVAVHLMGGNGIPPWRLGGKVTTLGMGTVPNGTSVTPGASGADGAWAQIIASTAEDYFALLPSFQLATDASIAPRVYYVDIGLGAAAAEAVLGKWMYRTDTASAELMDGPSNPFPIYQDIPAGSRLAIRASNSGTNEAAYNGVIHAIN